MSTWGGEALLADESLGGEGCPQVAAYAPEPLAVTFGVSPVTAMQLIADALDLRHRLPQTWALVESLSVPAWKARRVAQLTHTLPQEAAEWVDEKIAPRLQRCGARLLDTVLAEAIARYDPDRHAAREATGEEADLGRRPAHARARRSTPPPASSTSPATPCSSPTSTGTSAATPPPRARPATTARSASARSRRWQTCSPVVETHRPVVEQRAKRAISRDHPTRKTVLYLHLDLTDLDDDDLVKVGRAERLGPVTTTKIRDWVGNSNVRIQPVIRMDGDDAVDGHDPPDRMRDQVDPERSDLPVPELPGRLTPLRPRPRRPLRPRRTTRPNPTLQPRRRSAADTTTPRPAVCGATPARPKALACGPGPAASLPRADRAAVAIHPHRMLRPGHPA